MKVFITRLLPEIARKLLSEYFEVDNYDKNEAFPQSKLNDIVVKYDAILSTPTEKFTQKILEKKVNLKVLSNYGVGIDNIDVTFARSIGIYVYNTPDVVTNSTADLVFALLLSLIRKISPSSEFIKQNKWKNWDPFLFNGEDLQGKTLGIIGFGRIGQAVAKRATAFGLNIIYYDTINYQLSTNNYKKVNLDYLLQNSDYISLHVPLSDKTKNLINKEAFAKMNKAPVLINTSRGAVVSTDDLVSALESKLIRGAALDVTYPEPISGDNPLLKFKNCLITPHIGTATIETRFNMAKLAAENILNHFSKLQKF